jgi:hypothetical protein
VNQDKKTLLKKYLICFCVGVAIVFFVFAIKSFDITVTVLCDAFTSAGLLMMLFFGLLFVSSEGMFISMGYIFKRTLSFFIPMYRKDQETYSQYYERKREKLKGRGDSSIFFTGLFFFVIGLVFLAIWYQTKG